MNVAGWDAFDPNANQALEEDQWADDFDEFILEWWDKKQDQILRLSELIKFIQSDPDTRHRSWTYKGANPSSTISWRMKDLAGKPLEINDQIFRIVRTKPSNVVHYQLVLASGGKIEDKNIPSKY